MLPFVMSEPPDTTVSVAPEGLVKLPFMVSALPEATASSFPEFIVRLLQMAGSAARLEFTVTVWLMVTLSINVGIPEGDQLPAVSQFPSAMLILLAELKVKITLSETLPQGPSGSAEVSVSVSVPAKRSAAVGV